MSKAPGAQAPITVGGIEIAAGTRQSIRLPVTEQLVGGESSIPAVVVHGRRPGPRLFVCAAIHGDEINGVEIIRRILGMSALSKLRGTLIAVPIVNVFGFLNQSRYLPDRRDLNRSFPGSPRGSLAARLAHVFMTEVVQQCTHGIDLHTAAIHRSNLPQIRTSLDDEEAAKLARTFGVPVIINANMRDGSLRAEAAAHGIPMLLYEAGQALRFDEISVRAGARGVVAVMRELGMLRATRRAASKVEPVLARSSSWVRAGQGGILRTVVPLGARVARDATLGWISDPLGDNDVEVTATEAGILIGRTELPLVNEGDALFHVATVARPKEAEAHLQTFQAELDPAEDGEDTVDGEDAIR